MKLVQYLKEMNPANKLTLVRILAVPAIIFLLHFPSRMTCALATLLFVAASVTDIFDGMLARRHGWVTNFGKFLDPLADKILICSVLIMLVERNWVPAWIVILIVARETAVTGLRAVAADMGIVLAADTYGKYKTVFQAIALGFLVMHYPVFGIAIHGVGMLLLYIALVLTLLSGGHYFYAFYTNWSEKK